jgi:hypothetical protein
MGMGKMGEMCPMQVPGTQVAATDVEGGAAITFTTKGDASEVRARVHRMADMHNQMAAQPNMHMNMPASQATVEDIDGGARVVLKAVDPANVDAVRSMAHEHAQMMASSGECPMMKMMGKSQAPSPEGEQHQHEH